MIEKTVEYQVKNKDGAMQITASNEKTKIKIESISNIVEYVTFDVHELDEICKALLEEIQRINLLTS